MENKYPTLGELYALYRKGELKEGHYTCCHNGGDPSILAIWIPWSEIVAGVELSDRLKKESFKYLWGLKDGK